MQIERSHADTALGINLQEGATDGETTEESETEEYGAIGGRKPGQPPRHFITFITGDGLVGRDGRLRVGDELLEVNGIVLQGKEPSEVLVIMRTLPPGEPVNLVVARRKRKGRNQWIGVEDRPRSASDYPGPPGGPLIKSKSDGSLSSSMHESPSLGKSRSLERLDAPALWSDETEMVVLNKGEGGLGFSILDYQDPIDPEETMIVVRSLVPGGVAQMDGRLVPGDRIMAVNENDLRNASLDVAVSVLKGAPKGRVTIEIAKPLNKDESETEA